MPCSPSASPPREISLLCQDEGSLASSPLEGHIRNAIPGSHLSGGFFDMVIRPYSPGDLEALKQITFVCFESVSIDRNIEEKFGLIGGHDWRWRKGRQIEADVAGEHARGVFVAEFDGQVVGYITTRVDPEGRIGWIPNLAVLPQHQGKGLGRRLVETALDYLRRQGMECAKIETLEQNPVGPTFYPRLGFQEVGRQIHYLMRL